MQIFVQDSWLFYTVEYITKLLNRDSTPEILPSSNNQDSKAKFNSEGEGTRKYEATTPPNTGTISSEDTRVREKQEI